MVGYLTHRLMARLSLNIIGQHKTFFKAIGQADWHTLRQTGSVK